MRRPGPGLERDGSGYGYFAQLADNRVFYRGCIQSQQLEQGHLLVLTKVALIANLSGTDCRCFVTNVMQWYTETQGMKYLLGLVLGCMVLLFSPAATWAQMDELKNSTPEQRAQLQTQWMESNLSLDSKASATVADINLKYARETQSLMDSSSPGFQKLKTFRSNSAAKDAELKAILTPEQYTLYEQKKSAMEAMVKQKIEEKHQAAQ